MKLQTSRRAGRGMKAKAAAVTAGTLAMVLGTSIAASADGGAATATRVKDAQHQSASAGPTTFSSNAADPVWTFGIDGRDSSGKVWSYPQKTGGFGTRQVSFTNTNNVSAFFKNNANNDEDVNIYLRTGGQLRMFSVNTPDSGSVVGTGWDIYSAFVTPGNLGGAVNPDLLARDKSGVLWLYLSYGNGSFTSRHKVGPGWNTYSQIAGRGDLTSDGKDDIVARDGSGNLWLYKGTGNIDAPFSAKTKIGPGWNTYNKILGLGDTSGDGLNDLIARDGSGNLWLYKGTGNPGSPFQSRVKIGPGWNTYNYLF